MASNNFKQLLLASAVSMSLLTACGAASTPAKAKGQPDWVLNPPVSSSMVFGTGSAEVYTSVGEAKARAKDNARFQLVSNLRVTIDGQSLSRQSALAAESGRRSVSTMVSSFESAVKSKIPTIELAGLSILEYYHSEGERTVYALAQLDRAAAIADLNSKIDAVEAELAKINNSSPANNTLDKLRQLLPALELFEQHALLNEKLQIVSENKQNRVLSAELKAIEDRVFAELDKLTLSISANGDNSLQLGLTRAMTDIGFRVSDSYSADLQLEYTVSWRDMTRGSTQFTIAEATIQIKDNNQRVLSVIKQKAKGGSSDPVIAKNKAMDALAQQLGKELAENLVRLVD